MRRLLDENLSPRLARALADLCPGSIHVRDVGLAAASDDEVWTYEADVDVALAAALRRRGVDALTTQEAGNVQQRDEEQLAFAAKTGRVFLK